MDLRQANNDFFDNLIDLYKSKDMSRIQTIKPNWAFGSNASKILDRTIRHNQKTYIFGLTSTKELINNTNFFEVNTETMFTGVSLNDGRVARILHRWENNEFVDPPTIGILDNKRGVLAFSDGRHRAKVAYLIGCKEIPVAFHKLDYNFISSIIPLRLL